MAITIQDGAAADVNYIKESLVYEDTINQRGAVQFAADGSSPPLDIGEDVFLVDIADADLELVGGGALELVGGGELAFVARTTFWGGTVNGYDEIDITVGASTHLRFIYRCVDFDQLLSKRLIQRSFTDSTAGEIVEAIIADSHLVAEGITAGTIAAGPLIEKKVFNWRYAEDCMDEMAELTGFSWNIDKDKKLNFFPRDLLRSAYDITDANADYRKITFKRSRNLLRTVQYVRAASEIGDSRAETQTGDGSKRAFLAETAIGTVPTIEVNTGSGYVSKSVGVGGVDTGKDWYYNIGVRVFYQDGGGSVLSSSDKVKITYEPRIPLIVSNINKDLEDDRALVEAGNGRYEHIYDAPDIETRAEAINKAVSLLARFGNLQETVQYETDTTGLVAGTLQTINLSAHGVNADYLIERISANIKDNGSFRYTVQASASAAYGRWTHDFKDKTRQDRKFTPRENETVLNLRESKDSITMQDLPSTTSYAGAFTVNGVNTYINGFHVG